MDITLREGSYSDNEIDLEMSMAGIGILSEGPYSNGKGSYIASFRKSFVKYIRQNKENNKTILVYQVEQGKEQEKNINSIHLYCSPATYRYIKNPSTI